MNIKNILILTTLLIFSSSITKSQTLIPKKDLPRFKKSIAIVITPAYRTYVSRTGKHSQTHYVNLVQYFADSLNTKNINIQTETKNGSLYFDSRKGDLFSVLYDSLNLHDCFVFPSLALLDTTSRIDTTIGTITAIDRIGSSFTFSYNLNNIELTRTQDACDNDLIYNAYPQIVKGRQFFVKYQVSDNTKAILMMDKPADKKPYHFYAHNNLIGFSVLPLTKVSLIYSHIILKKLALGLTVSNYYDPFHIASILSSAQHKNVMPYSKNYFSFENAISISPTIKWYMSNYAPLGLYLKFQPSFLSIKGIKSNYINASAFPDSTANYFSSLLPSNKTITSSTNINTFGFQLGLGASFFFGKSSYKWVMDFAAGFQYFKLPNSLKTNKIIDGTTYYYHDTPVWNNLFNFGGYFEWNIYRKF